LPGVCGTSCHGMYFDFHGRNLADQTVSSQGPHEGLSVNPTFRSLMPHISHPLRRSVLNFSERDKPRPIRPQRPFQALGF
jgi:hypothetical protein